MKVLSFAQNREDVLLWRALQHVDPRTAFWIDIGAADPLDNSVTKWFSMQGWRGVNVEPVPSVHARLVADRPHDHNVHAAVGLVRGSMEFGLVHDNTELSTFDHQLLAHYQSQGLVVTHVPVPVLTLADVFAEHSFATRDLHHVADQSVLSECAVLKVDVEGYELAALQGNDWERNRPWIVMVEATTPEQWLPTLSSAHYEQVLDDGLNFVFVSHERRDNYARILSRPVSSLDDHQLYRYAVAPEERTSRTFRWAVQQVASDLARASGNGAGTEAGNARDGGQRQRVGEGCRELAHLLVSRIDLQRAFAGDGQVNRGALLSWALTTSPADDPEVALLVPHYEELRSLRH